MNMLTSKIKVFGKTIPVWIAGLALVAATAGAATGVVLAGSVRGEIVTTVSQSLLVESTTAKILNSNGTIGASVTAQFNAVSDDRTKFTAAVEMQQSEGVVIEVTASNKSTDTMAVLIRLDLMPGVTADIDGADAAAFSGSTGDSCVRVNLTDWKCKLGSDSSTAAATATAVAGNGTGTPPTANATADFKIKLALHDQILPGFYTTTVTMTQIENKS